MSIDDFYKLELGEYELTDDLHNYRLIVDLTVDGNRIYAIKQKGSLFSSFFNMHESMDGDSGKKRMTYSARIGGIFIHSTERPDDLRNLKIVTPSK